MAAARICECRTCALICNFAFLVVTATGAYDALRQKRSCSFFGYNNAVPAKTTRSVKNKPANSAKPKLILEKSAGAVVFHRGKDIEYLLLRANHWEFPKGLIDAHEREEDAALREVREETGLAISLVSNFRETIQYFYRHKLDGAPVRKQVIYFLGEAKSRAHKISWEHQDARWVTCAQALELIEYENARAILQKAHQRITHENSLH